MDGDENSSHDIGKFFTSFEDLCKRYGAAGIINHHPGHSTEGRSRGSSAMRPSLDTELLLTKKRGGQIVLEHGKFKDGPEQPDVGYQLKQVTLPWPDAKGNLITSCVSDFYSYDGNTAANKQTKPVPPDVGIAIKSLNKAMDSAGAATKKEWRDTFFKDRTGSHEGTKKAFNRSVIVLEKYGVVCAEQDKYRFGDYADCPWSNLSEYLPSSPK